MSTAREAAVDTGQRDQGPVRPMGDDVLSRAYDAMRLQGAGGHATGLRLMTRELGLLRLADATFRLRVEDGGPVPGAVMVGSVSGGTLRCTRREGMAVGAGGSFVMDLPGCDGTTLLEDVDVQLAMLDGRLVEELAGTSAAESQLHFTGPVPVSPAAGRQWRSTHAYVDGQARTNPALVSQPLVVGALSRLLAATALATFPHSGTAEETAADRRAAHPRALRRAIAFAEERAHEDIATADLARAAHVSVRTIQLAFRRHLGTTPTAHLRQIRLVRAREDLRHADPERTTVSAVAGRWGFLSASRFAAHYRDVFGELPHQTLRG